MNKKPVFIVIAALSAIGVVIAVGIFTKLRLGQEAAINGTAPVNTATAPVTTVSADAAGGDAQTASAAAAAAAAARAAQESAMQAAEEGAGEAPAAH